MFDLKFKKPLPVDDSARNTIIKLKENERKFLDRKDRDARKMQKDAEKMQNDAERIKQLEDDLEKSKKEALENKKVEESPKEKEEATGGLSKAQIEAIENFERMHREEIVS